MGRGGKQHPGMDFVLRPGWARRAGVWEEYSLFKGKFDILFPFYFGLRWQKR